MDEALRAWRCAQVLNVLAIGAHMDDCEIGCGATLAKHILAGDAVAIMDLSLGVGSRGDGDDGSARQEAARVALMALAGDVEYIRVENATGSLPDQRFDTVAFLDIVQNIERTAKEAGYAPDIIYTHHEGDLNLDHAITARAVKTAFRPKPGVKAPKILAFEVLSTTELGSPFVPTVYVDVTGEPMARKVKALEAYGEELPAAPHPRSLLAVKYKAFSRGSEVGIHDAEAFVLIREVIR
jgi:LmbE family N-acetylglucosaminyl deacetylase